ncbi:2-amino-4,5-dihydroxy-6-one-heptanoic acid-7-phosphate synthase [Nocardiopsis alba]|uniref:2-amino-4,5-dihydroxy-6-one-heptanoic acid-7-phosphate synthase n=1 Tax=Nocardiopsis alba TaxID=53437 RepID=A0A7K2J0J5_9ACTN|nr:2-amino-3,7-dideoxy-D-threo-hept-6-ulosonate synthase [Nocardiopsis alba]MYR35555.1 2-amino-4,5-dihydroxy-6-one-heptanoic acid-7-phosphate synthase [Nocardiopsis alba]
MLLNGSFARRIRGHRLYRYADERLLVVPLDHSISDGPITGRRSLDDLVGTLSTSGVDAVVLHKGALRYVDPLWFAETSLIVHLSASTAHAPDPDAKYLVAGVEESLRMGADAVSVHVNMGSDQEARQIADLAAVAESCDRWNVPLLAMMYARGPQITDPQDQELVAHTAGLAADLGADIVKTAHVTDISAMRDITRACPIPLITAGGARREGLELESMVSGVLEAGAAGLAIGRSVFQSPDPGGTARRLAELVHGEAAASAGVYRSALAHATSHDVTGAHA